MTVVEQLRKLAPTHTQTRAAKAVGVSKQLVNQLADKHGIVFAERPAPPVVSRCTRCSFQLDNPDDACPRCKWTVGRIKRIRKRLGLSQLNMSLRLGLHPWTVQRWEAKQNRPNADSLARLDRLEAETA